MSSVPAGDVNNTGTFDPKALVEHDTDIVYDGLTFTKPGVTELGWYGMPSCSSRFFKQVFGLVQLIKAVDKRQVAILDARKRNLDYETCGFTLRPLQSKVSDWQQVSMKDSEQQLLFQAELEKVIRELHPDVKKIQFEGTLLRGGAGANPPATNGLHLDLYPDMERVKVTSGKDDDQDISSAGLELRMVLGLWMPREMANPVYDYPLLVSDASTFTPEDVVPQKQDFYHTAEGERQRVINLAAGAPVFAPRQRWYYYNQQKCDEVAIFRHLTEPAGGKACFHASIQQPLPDGMATRKSIETRAFLYFSKSTE